MYRAYSKLTLILSILILCGLVSACGYFVDSENVNPGDAEYVPPGWEAPALSFATSAYFPSRVVEYRQAPGQYAVSADFKIEGNTSKLLGPPEGGGIYGADNSSVVSLGMAGGYVIYEFDPPIANHPDNIGGYDFIVYGNSFWSGGAPSSPTWEPGVIHVMQDENQDGEINDTWYLIPGSHLTSTDSSQRISYSISFDSDGGTVSWTGGGEHDFSSSHPWWPEESPDPKEFADVWVLPDTLYTGSPPQEEYKDVWGYADIAPTMIRGDMDGNGDTHGPEDYPGIDPAFFYTTPDTHGDNTIDNGSGGGSAIKLEWAVDPAHGFTGVSMDEVRWIRISSSSVVIDSMLGEKSCEVDAVARVRRK